MSYDDFRRRADRVRDIPLERVLELCDAVRDRRDRQKWHTEQGPISIQGQKFINWQGSHGGGGAIDLVMHLAQLDVGAAVAWLERHCGGYAAAPVVRQHGNGNRPAAATAPTSTATSRLRLPLRNLSKLPRVRDYLTRRRHLCASVVERLIEEGKLYADCRGNAVFLMVAGKPNRPIGAELRGTGSRAWRGLAPGSRKEAGYFWIGAEGSTRVVLCESAIDAISCAMLYPDRICVSTAGARPNPVWLRVLLDHGYQVDCGFDADLAGDTAAKEMMRLHPQVRRLRPAAKDWNAVLSPTS